jgi:hypothetical protein
MQLIDPSKVKDAIMNHNSARGSNTMEFPIGKFARCKQNGERHILKFETA